jgi:hypothetical protein
MTERIITAGYSSWRLLSLSTCCLLSGLVCFSLQFKRVPSNLPLHPSVFRRLWASSDGQPALCWPSACRAATKRAVHRCKLKHGAAPLWDWRVSQKGLFLPRGAWPRQQYEAARAVWERPLEGPYCVDHRGQRGAWPRLHFSTRPRSTAPFSNDASDARSLNRIPAKARAAASRSMPTKNTRNAALLPAFSVQLQPTASSAPVCSRERP